MPARVSLPLPPVNGPGRYHVAYMYADSLSSRPVEPLGLETIIAAAAELIESEGLAKLTMRRLASRLDCSAMALYRHVATKQDLLRAIGEHYLAGIEFPDVQNLDWREAIIAAAAAVHHRFLEWGPLLEILPVQHVDAVAVLQAEELILQALKAGGLTDRDAVRELSVITSYAVGATQRQAGQRLGSPAEVERLRRLLQLPADQFPTMRALAGELVSVDIELSFEDGLRRLLDGIAPR
jgi:AcrR family transcriptional regulator